MRWCTIHLKLLAAAVAILAGNDSGGSLAVFQPLAKFTGSVVPSPSRAHRLTLQSWTVFGRNLEIIGILHHGQSRLRLENRMLWSTCPAPEMGDEPDETAQEVSHSPAVHNRTEMRNDLVVGENGSGSGVVFRSGRFRLEPDVFYRDLETERHYFAFPLTTLAQHPDPPVQCFLLATSRCLLRLSLSLPRRLAPSAGIRPYRIT